MNSDISAVQCGKAPELILLSKCHILLNNFFFRLLSPQQSRQLNAATVMLSTVPAEDLLQRAATPHTECNNAFTSQWELHPNMQETANERADDHLVEGEKKPKKPPTFSGHKTTACRCTTSSQRTPEVLCWLSHSTQDSGTHISLQQHKMAL